MSKEEWRDVVGWEGWYQVSSYGRVMRVASGINAKLGAALKPSKNKDGYVCVNLCAQRRQQVKKVHKMVAEAFIGIPPDGFEVNHKNLNKADNRVENLEYVTHTENMRHAAKHLGKFMAKSGESNNSAKLTERQVSEIRRLYAGGGTSIRALAKQFGVSKSTIAYIISRHTWK